jgi:hypothetical protein
MADATMKMDFEVGDRVRYDLDLSSEGTILAIVEGKWAVVRWDGARLGPSNHRIDNLRPVPKVNERLYPTIVVGDVVAPKSSGKADLNQATYRVLQVHASWAWCVPTNGPGPITFAIPDLQIIRKAGS